MDYFRRISRGCRIGEGENEGPRRVGADSSRASPKSPHTSVRVLSRGAGLDRRLDRPLISTAPDVADEAPVAERGDDQAAAREGGMRSGIAGRTECHQPAEIGVRAPERA